MITLNEFEQQIAAILVEAANVERTVSFTEIMKRVGISRRKIGKYLSQIGNKCKELGLPIITVLVVYKGTSKVGKGYIEFEPDFINNPSLVKSQTEKVYKQKNWSGLVNIAYDIDGVWLEKSSDEGEREYVKIAVPYRDVKLRDECLKKYGRVCAVCGFDGSKYGISPNTVIEVHHKNPIKNGVRKTTVDDLVPVCPNCHKALHSKSGGAPYTVEELKKIMNENKK